MSWLGDTLTQAVVAFSALSATFGAVAREAWTQWRAHRAALRQKALEEKLDLTASGLLQLREDTGKWMRDEELRATREELREARKELIAARSDVVRAVNGGLRQIATRDRLLEQARADYLELRKLVDPHGIASKPWTHEIITERPPKDEQE